MQKVLGILFLVCFSCAGNGYAQGLDDEGKATLLQWQKRCDQEFSNPKLSLLRGKIAYWSANITDEMLKNEQRPTKGEQSALKVFYAATDRCNTIARELYPSSTEAEARNAATLDNLSLLKERRLTFGEYNRREKQATDALLARVQKEYAEKSPSAPSSFYLSCVMESPALFRGLESTYFVDPANNTISGSRGVPEEIVIGPTDIRFNIKNNDGSLSSVQISRLSGRYNMFTDGFLITGLCQQANKRKF